MVSMFLYNLSWFCCCYFLHNSYRAVKDAVSPYAVILVTFLDFVQLPWWVIEMSFSPVSPPAPHSLASLSAVQVLGEAASFLSVSQGPLGAETQERGNRHWPPLPKISTKTTKLLMLKIWKRNAWMWMKLTVKHIWFPCSHTHYASGIEWPLSRTKFWSPSFFQM